MPVGILRVDLRLPGVSGLKEKRRILLRLKAALKNKFNLSVAETGMQDTLQRAQMEIAAAGAARDVIENELRHALRILDSQDDCQVVDREVEIVP